MNYLGIKYNKTCTGSEFWKIQSSDVRNQRKLKRIGEMEWYTIVMDC